MEEEEEEEVESESCENEVVSRFRMPEKKEEPEARPNYCEDEC